MIEIVIKIPEDEYNIAKYGQYGNINVDVVRKAIADGTPLPEHHGRLIDADELMENCAYFETILDLEEVPTIIEGSDSE